MARDVGRAPRRGRARAWCRCAGSRRRSAARRCGGPPARARCRGAGCRRARLPRIDLPSNVISPRDGRQRRRDRRERRRLARAVVADQPDELALAHVERRGPARRRCGRSCTCTSRQLKHQLLCSASCRSRPRSRPRSFRISSGEPKAIVLPSPAPGSRRRRRRSPTCRARPAARRTRGGRGARGSRGQLVGSPLVEAGRRLVEQQEARLHRDAPARCRRGARRRTARPPRQRPARWSMPSWASTSRARSRAARRAQPRAEGPELDVLGHRHAARRHASPGRCAPCRRRARSAGDEPVTSRPSRQHRPRRERREAAHACRNVVLPAPFGPIRPRIAPLAQGQVDAVDGADALVVDVDVASLQGRSARPVDGHRQASLPPSYSLAQGLLSPTSAISSTR